MKRDLFIAMVLVFMLIGGGVAFAETNQEKLDAIVKQEETLIFDKFDNNDAFELGMLMINKAKEKNSPIAVDIVRSGQQLFRVSLPGTSADNDRWIKRKNACVNRTFRSSLRVFFENKVTDWAAEFDMDYYTMFGLDTKKGVAIGGAFPLKVKGVGCIGTITVSGLPHELDHKHVVDCLRIYLKK